MTTKKKPPTPEAGTFRSSITVADELVCEDEACIGKVIDADVPPPAEDRRSPAKHHDRTNGSSISVAGRQACSDDACIGKT